MPIGRQTKHIKMPRLTQERSHRANESYNPKAEIGCGLQSVKINNENVSIVIIF